MKAYHVSGWYRTLAPGLCGKSTTRSDGIFFSSPEIASLYANTKMERFRIDIVELDDNNPAINYYINSGIWTPPKHLALMP